jgi:hypothetical protein
MIGDLPILRSDSPSLVSSHPRAYLLTPVVGAGTTGLGLLELPQTSSQNEPGDPAVLRPIALGFAAHDESGGLVEKPDRAVGLVPVLTASTRATHERLIEIVLAKLDLGIGRLGQDRHRHCAGVNPAPLLVGRNPLPAVASWLILEGLYGSLAGDSEDAEPRTLLYEFEVKVPSEPPTCSRWPPAPPRGASRRLRPRRIGLPR